jgi:hypothetical protein
MFNMKAVKDEQTKRDCGRTPKATMARGDVKEPLDLRKGKKVANTIGGRSRSVGKGNENYKKTRREVELQE